MKIEGLKVRSAFGAQHLLLLTPEASSQIPFGDLEFHNP